MLVAFMKIWRDVSTLQLWRAPIQHNLWWIFRCFITQDVCDHVTLLLEGEGQNRWSNLACFRNNSREHVSFLQFLREHGSLRTTFLRDQAGEELMVSARSWPRVQDCKEVNTSDRPNDAAPAVCMAIFLPWQLPISPHWFTSFFFFAHAQRSS